MSYINSSVRLQCKLNRKHSRSSMGLWDSASGKCLNTWSETETSLVHLLSPSTGTYSCFDLCRHQTYKPVSKNSQRRAFPKKEKLIVKAILILSIWVKKKTPIPWEVGKEKPMPSRFMFSYENERQQSPLRGFRSPIFSHLDPEVSSIIHAAVQSIHRVLGVPLVIKPE